MKEKEANDKVIKNNKEVYENNERIMIEVSSKRHISYEFRITLLSFLFVLMLVLTAILAFMYFNYHDESKIYYNQTGIVDYRLYLKDNKANIKSLDKNDLQRNSAYLIDLVDKLDVNFNYSYDISENSNINFKYHVVAEVVINDANTNKELYSEQFTLVHFKDSSIVNGKSIKIVEKVNDLDFAYYQSIASNYASNFTEDTKSYLKVYLELRKQNDRSEKDFILDDIDQVLVTIPLYSDSFLSDITNVDLVQKEQLVDRVGFTNSKRNILCLIGITIILALYFMLQLYNLLGLIRNKKGIYEIYVDNLLKKYDKYIVESTSIIDFKKFDVIKIKNFNELLDVCKNLELPIIYYEVVKKQKGYFYVKNNNDIYLLQIKAVDLENL